MRIRAAVVEEKAGPFVVQELELGDPRPSELLVRMVATGICATDIHVRDQDYPVPLPLVLGHEGAGVVEQVGGGVRGIVPGDRVVLSYPSCGLCRACHTGHNPYCEHAYEICFGGARLDGSNGLRRSSGEAVNGHFFGQSSFASYALADMSNVVKVEDDDLPLDMLGPLGCGFQTGAGAVLVALGVRPGASFAVFGAGAVGLAATMAARIAGADPIIAVDVHPERLSLAIELGATHTIDARGGNVMAEIGSIARRGLDHVVESSATPEMLALALEAVGPLGTAALVGGAPAGAKASLDMNALLNGRMLRGVVQGDAVPQVFIADLIAHYRAGRFPFDRLLRFYEFDAINEAIADMQSGSTVKAVLRIGAA